MNATVGDIAGNARRIRQGIAAARDAGADLVLFGELALTGYPPEDLLLRQGFLRDARRALDELAARGERHGGRRRLSRGRRRAPVQLGRGARRWDGRRGLSQAHLPNYGVFDERRYFAAGPRARGDRGGRRARRPDRLRGPLGARPAGLRRGGVGRRADRQHLGLALPGRQGRRTGSAVRPARDRERRTRRLLRPGRRSGRARLRRALVRARRTPARRSRAPGSSRRTCSSSSSRRRLRRACRGGPRAALRRSRRPALPDATSRDRPPAVAAGGRADLRRADARAARLRRQERLPPRRARALGRHRLGARSPALAVDALGARARHVVVMPSPYSSAATQGDARALAQRTRGLRPPIEHRDRRTRPMERLRTRPLASRRSDGADAAPAASTAENLQARIRGNLLMALSNRFGWLVLTTGNKSELSVGYSHALRRPRGRLRASSRTSPRRSSTALQWRNSPGAGRAPATRAGREPRSRAVDHRARPRRAELRPDQRDEDSLPPYELLDRILAGLRRARPGTRASSSQQGLPAAEVDRAIRARRPRRVQAPPGPPGHQGHLARLRARPAHADHQPLSRARRCPVSRGRPRRQAPARSPRSARAVRAGERRVRRHVAESADRAQRPRGHARRPLSGLLAGWQSFRGTARSPKCAQDPSGAFQRAVRRLRAGRPEHLHAGPARRHLAGQQLHPRRLTSRAARGSSARRRRTRRRSGPHDRAPRPPAWWSDIHSPYPALAAGAAADGRPDQRTRRAAGARCPPAFPTRASPTARCRHSCPRRCTRRPGRRAALRARPDRAGRRSA